MELSIDFKDHNSDISVIEVSGEITFENADTFRESIDKKCDSGNKNLVVDLRNLKYMSSAGMGVLVHGLKIARKLGGDLRLCNLNSKMQRIFMITQFTHHFKVFKSVEEAVESFIQK